MDLGRFVVLFSHLDTDVSFLLSALLKPLDNISRNLVISRLEYKQKLNLLRDIIKLRFEKKLLIEFEDLYKSLTDIGYERNDFMHSLWQIDYDEDDNDIYKVNHRKRNKTSDFIITIENQVRDSSKKVRAIMKDVKKFTGKIYSALYAK